MREITCYGGGYKVTDKGEVHNSRGLRMSQKNDSKNRYKMINLSFKNKKKMFLVHRLVALAYLPRIDKKPHVNHIDGDKKNNALSNLEWVDASENLKHSYHILGNKFKPCMLGKLGEDHNKSKPITLKSPLGNVLKFGSGLEVERELGFGSSCFTYAKKKGLPYGFKKGPLKGWTLIE